MKNFADAALGGLVERSNIVALDGSELDAEGYAICPKCRTRRQMDVEIVGEVKRVGKLCACRAEEREKEAVARKARAERDRVERLRKTGVTDPAYLNHRFEADESPDSRPGKIARAYVEKWPEMKKSSYGLLFYGPVGTGKSFYAGCIANALIDQGIRVLMTNTLKILDKLNAMTFDADKASFIYQLTRNKLVILDDVGAENMSDYAAAQLFNAVDALSRANTPLIVTSNFTMEQLINPGDTRKERIYDRLLERCRAVMVDGVSRRKKQHLAVADEMNEILGV